MSRKRKIIMILTLVAFVLSLTAAIMYTPVTDDAIGRMHQIVVVLTLMAIFYGLYEIITPQPIRIKLTEGAKRALRKD